MAGRRSKITRTVNRRRMVARKRKPVGVRFWAKVRKSLQCWEWTGKLSSGYGKLWILGKHVAAHRYSWALHNGDIGKGLCICHHCDNSGCVNPHHLFEGTRKMNMVDMVNKGRNKSHYGKGESHGGSKLTDIDVRVIRAYYPAINTVKLGEIFGVSNVNISEIVRRVRWSHI